MPKKIIIDRADRLYQMPQPVEHFYPRLSPLTPRKAPRQANALDLARPIWSESSNPNQTEFSKGDQRAINDGLIPANQSELDSLKETIAEWAATELGVRIDPRREVILAGGVRALCNLTGMAYLDPGDLALFPNPGYPVYRQTIVTYGAEPVGYRLTEKRKFRPQIKRFSERIGKAARLMFLTNPHNPSGAELDSDELDELLWLAARDNIMMVSDAAYYAHSMHEGTSIFSSPSGKRIGLEFYSLKLLTGEPHLPLGFALGSRGLISGLQAAADVNPQLIIKSWVSRAQKALESMPSSNIQATRARIRDAWPEALELCEALNLIPCGREGFPFLLARISGRRSSQSLAATLLRRHGLITLPGVAFGDLGEGYLRLSLTGGPLLFQEARARLGSDKKTAKNGGATAG